MTKKIIVPTDFSENAFIAAKYACQLALTHGYGIYLFHCYSAKITIFDEKINEKETITPLLRGDLIMAEWVDSLSKEFPSLLIESECKNGLITDILPKIATEPPFSLIVIGSNGLSRDASPMFGSTTSQIATQSHIPVLAIPANIAKHENTKTAILTNFKDDELDSLKDFISLVSQIHELDIIHVYQNSDDKESVNISLKNWAEKIQEITPKTKINTVLKPINYSDKGLDTIAEVINNTIKENKYDIVIVTKTRKSFFDKWFSISISKEIILELEAATYFDNN